MTPTTEHNPVDGFLDALGGRLHYLDWGGSGPQIHFLHGNGFCAGTYTPFLSHLTADFHILASDVRGHGGSLFMGAPRIRGWEIFAQDLRLTIEKALQPPVIGMGHSLGAVTTLMAAASAPHLFAALVLIEPALFPRSVLWRIAVLKFLGLGGTLRPARRARRRKRVFKDRQAALERFADGRGIFKSWSPEFVEAYLACGLLQKDAQRAVLTCDPELEAQIFESVPLNVWSYVKKLAVPVLVIRGEASDVFAVKAAEGIRAVRPDARIAVIRRAGHFVPMERPAACARVILPFLRSLDSTAAAEGAGRSTRTRRVA